VVAADFGRDWSQGDHATLDGINKAVKGLLADRFVITVLGKAKRGKSTLLNALLGRSDDTLAPIDKLPAYPPANCSNSSGSFKLWES
jgi:ribosome biogenesis GTPase A